MLGEFEIVHIFNFNHLVHLLGLIADIHTRAQDVITIRDTKQLEQRRREPKAGSLINAGNPAKKSIFVTAVEFVPAILRRKSLKI